jgi:hypothetical protein
LENIKNSDFDLDYRNGKRGEDLVAHALEIETVEVKRDLMWFKTGNLYIETQCWNNTQDQLIPSGIKVTKSQWWFWVLGNTIIAVPTKQLKELLNKLHSDGKLREVANRYPPNPSFGVLIRVWDLLEFQKQKGYEITEFDTPTAQIARINLGC